MKKIFTLALGLIAAASASAAITVTANHDENVVAGSTVTAHKTLMQEIGGIQIFEINPELTMVSDVNGNFTVTVTLVELDGKSPQFCWPDGCQMFSAVGDVRTASANVEAGVAQNLQVDNVMIYGAVAEQKIYNKLNVSITSSTLDEPFDFTVVLTSEEAGVENIAVDNNNAPKAYFDLSGREVANPANGLYIVRQGSKVTKEYIR